MQSIFWFFEIVVVFMILGFTKGFLKRFPSYNSNQFNSTSRLDIQKLILKNSLIIKDFENRLYINLGSDAKKCRQRHGPKIRAPTHPNIRQLD